MLVINIKWFLKGYWLTAKLSKIFPKTQFSLFVAKDTEELTMIYRYCNGQLIKTEDELRFITFSRYLKHDAKNFLAGKPLTED